MASSKGKILEADEDGEVSLDDSDLDSELSRGGHLEQLRNLPGARKNLTCPDCQQTKMVLRSSRFGLFYGCPKYPDCQGKHGAHKDGTPKGVPGNQAVRAARIKAHEAFDELWKSGGMTREQAYTWMQRQLRLPPEQAHIGVMSEAGCARLVEIVRRHLEGPPTRADRILRDDIL